MTYELVLEKTAPRENRRVPRGPTIVGSTGEIFSYPSEVSQEIASLYSEDVLSRATSDKMVLRAVPTKAFLASVHEYVALVEPIGATTTAPDLETSHLISPPFDKLSPKAAIAVTSQWQVPCEGAFEFLADYFPNDLVRLVSAGILKPVDLTLAAESVGRIPVDALVQRTLTPLLEHSDAIVREGAIYGLRGHENVEIRARLAHMATSDPNWGVRQVAADALTEF